MPSESSSNVFTLLITKQKFQPQKPLRASFTLEWIQRVISPCSWQKISNMHGWVALPKPYVFCYKEQRTDGFLVFKKLTVKV
jgi:hypothetical protein